MNKIHACMALRWNGTKKTVLAHQDGKRPRNGPLFGGAHLTIEPGSDFRNSRTFDEAVLLEPRGTQQSPGKSGPLHPLAAGSSRVRENLISRSVSRITILTCEAP